MTVLRVTARQRLRMRMVPTTLTSRRPHTERPVKAETKPFDQSALTVRSAGVLRGPPRLTFCRTAETEPFHQSALTDWSKGLVPASTGHTGEGFQDKTTCYPIMCYCCEKFLRSLGRGMTYMPCTSHALSTVKRRLPWGRAKTNEDLSRRKKRRKHGPFLFFRRKAFTPCLVTSSYPTYVASHQDRHITFLRKSILVKH